MKNKNFDKLRGGYYTPEKISDFICKWAKIKDGQKILEPSCGDGIFLKSIKNVVNETYNLKNILAIELMEEEAKKANKIINCVVNSDFFCYYKDNLNGKEKFDLIVGNPPFIRYQNFKKEYRDIAFELLEEKNIRLNKLTNIWLPFLILSAYTLKDNGKLGMVLPAELLQVDYASEGRKFLMNFFERVTIITFSKIVFEDTQEDVVIILAEKKSNKKGVSYLEINNIEQLDKIDLKKVEELEIKHKDNSGEKWLKYYLANEEIDLIERISNSNNIITTNEVFETNVGVVTGENKFFIIDKNIVNKYNVSNSVKKIIGRSEQLTGIILNQERYDKLVECSKRVFLFCPESKLSECDNNYIKYGEKNSFNTGYKCRIRKKWYEVPLSWKPEAFILRQVHKFPRMIFNNADTYNTDTLHKVRFKEGVNGKNIVTSFINSYTFALAEITGRSYGGGVLTFEPNEIRKLKIPNINHNLLNIEKIDNLILNNKIDEALKINDDILLIKGLGLTKEEVKTLNSIWRKLVEKRINKKTNT